MREDVGSSVHVRSLLRRFSYGVKKWLLAVHDLAIERLICTEPPADAI